MKQLGIGKVQAIVVKIELVSTTLVGLSTIVGNGMDLNIRAIDEVECHGRLEEWTCLAVSLTAIAWSWLPVRSEVVPTKCDRRVTERYFA